MEIHNQSEQPVLLFDHWQIIVFFMVGLDFGFNVLVEIVLFQIFSHVIHLHRIRKHLICT